MLANRSSIVCMRDRESNLEDTGEWQFQEPRTTDHRLPGLPANQMNVMEELLLDRSSSFDSFLFINWWAKCLFSLSEDLFLFSGSLVLGAPLIGVHCERRYTN